MSFLTNIFRFLSFQICIFINTSSKTSSTVRSFHYEMGSWRKTCNQMKKKVCMDPVRTRHPHRRTGWIRLKREFLNPAHLACGRSRKGTETRPLSLIKTLSALHRQITPTPPSHSTLPKKGRNLPSARYPLSKIASGKLTARKQSASFQWNIKDSLVL